MDLTFEVTKTCDGPSGLLECGGNLTEILKNAPDLFKRTASRTTLDNRFGKYAYMLKPGPWMPPKVKRRVKKGIKLMERFTIITMNSDMQCKLDDAGLKASKTSGNQQKGFVSEILVSGTSMGASVSSVTDANNNPPNKVGGQGDHIQQDADNVLPVIALAPTCYSTGPTTFPASDFPSHPFMGWMPPGQMLPVSFSAGQIPQISTSAGQIQAASFTPFSMPPISMQPLPQVPMPPPLPPLMNPLMNPSPFQKSDVHAPQKPMWHLLLQSDSFQDIPTKKYMDTSFDEGDKDVHLNDAPVERAITSSDSLLPSDTLSTFIPHAEGGDGVKNLLHKMFNQDVKLDKQHTRMTEPKKVNLPHHAKTSSQKPPIMVKQKQRRTRPDTVGQFHGRTLLCGEQVPPRIVPMEALYKTHPYKKSGALEIVPYDPRPILSTKTERKTDLTYLSYTTSKNTRKKGRNEKLKKSKTLNGLDQYIENKLKEEQIVTNIKQSPKEIINQEYSPSGMLSPLTCQSIIKKYEKQFFNTDLKSCQDDFTSQSYTDMLNMEQETAYNKPNLPPLPTRSSTKAEISLPGLRDRITNDDMELESPSHADKHTVDCSPASIQSVSAVEQCKEKSISRPKSPLDHLLSLIGMKPRSRKVNEELLRPRDNALVAKSDIKPEQVRKIREKRNSRKQLIKGDASKKKIATSTGDAMQVEIWDLLEESTREMGTKDSSKDQFDVVEMPEDKQGPQQDMWTSVDSTGSENVYSQTAPKEWQSKSTTPSKSGSVFSGRVGDAIKSLLKNEPVGSNETEPKKDLPKLGKVAEIIKVYERLGNQNESLATSPQANKLGNHTDKMSDSDQALVNGSNGESSLDTTEAPTAQQTEACQHSPLTLVEEVTNTDEVLECKNNEERVYDVSTTAGSSHMMEAIALTSKCEEETNDKLGHVPTAVSDDLMSNEPNLIKDPMTLKQSSILSNDSHTNVKMQQSPGFKSNTIEYCKSATSNTALCVEDEKADAVQDVLSSTETFVDTTMCDDHIEAVQDSCDTEASVKRESPSTKSTGLLKDKFDAETAIVRIKTKSDSFEDVAARTTVNTDGKTDISDTAIHPVKDESDATNRDFECNIPDVVPEMMHVNPSIANVGVVNELEVQVMNLSDGTKETEEEVLAGGNDNSRGTVNAHKSDQNYPCNLVECWSGNNDNHENVAETFIWSPGRQDLAKKAKPAGSDTELVTFDAMETFLPHALVDEVLKTCESIVNDEDSLHTLNYISDQIPKAEAPCSSPNTNVETDGSMVYSGRSIIPLILFNTEHDKLNINKDVQDGLEVIENSLQHSSTEVDLSKTQKGLVLDKPILPEQKDVLKHIPPVKSKERKEVVAGESAGSRLSKIYVANKENKSHATGKSFATKKLHISDKGFSTGKLPKPVEKIKFVKQKVNTGKVLKSSLLLSPTMFGKDLSSKVLCRSTSPAVKPKSETRRKHLRTERSSSSKQSNQIFTPSVQSKSRSRKEHIEHKPTPKSTTKTEHTDKDQSNKEKSSSLTSSRLPIPQALNSVTKKENSEKGSLIGSKSSEPTLVIGKPHFKKSKVANNDCKKKTTKKNWDISEDPFSFFSHEMKKPTKNTNKVIRNTATSANVQTHMAENSQEKRIAKSECDEVKSAKDNDRSSHKDRSSHSDKSSHKDRHKDSFKHNYSTNRKDRSSHKDSSSHSDKSSHKDRHKNKDSFKHNDSTNHKDRSSHKDKCSHEHGVIPGTGIEKFNHKADESSDKNSNSVRNEVQSSNSVISSKLPTAKDLIMSKNRTASSVSGTVSKLPRVKTHKRQKSKVQSRSSGSCEERQSQKISSGISGSDVTEKVMKTLFGSDDDFDDSKNKSREKATAASGSISEHLKPEEVGAEDTKLMTSLNSEPHIKQEQLACDNITGTSLKESDLKQEVISNDVNEKSLALKIEDGKLKMSVMENQNTHVYPTRRNCDVKQCKIRLIDMVKDFHLFMLSCSKRDSNFIIRSTYKQSVNAQPRKKQPVTIKSQQSAPQVKPSDDTEHCARTAGHSRINTKMKKPRGRPTNKKLCTTSEICESSDSASQSNTPRHEPMSESKEERNSDVKKSRGRSQGKKDNGHDYDNPDKCIAREDHTNICKQDSINVSDVAKCKSLVWEKVVTKNTDRIKKEYSSNEKSDESVFFLPVVKDEQDKHPIIDSQLGLHKKPRGRPPNKKLCITSETCESSDSASQSNTPKHEPRSESKEERNNDVTLMKKSRGRPRGKKDNGDDHDNPDKCIAREDHTNICKPDSINVSDVAKCKSLVREKVVTKNTDRIKKEYSSNEKSDESVFFLPVVKDEQNKNPIIDSQLGLHKKPRGRPPNKKNCITSETSESSDFASQSITPKHEPRSESKEERNSNSLVMEKVVTKNTDCIKKEYSSNEKSEESALFLHVVKDEQDNYPVIDSQPGLHKKSEDNSKKTMELLGLNNSVFTDETSEKSGEESFHSDPTAVKMGASDKLKTAVPDTIACEKNAAVVQESYCDEKIHDFPATLKVEYVPANSGITAQNLDGCREEIEKVPYGYASEDHKLTDTMHSSTVKNMCNGYLVIEAEKEISDACSEDQPYKKRKNTDLDIDSNHCVENKVSNFNVCKAIESHSEFVSNDIDTEALLSQKYQDTLVSKKRRLDLAIPKVEVSPVVPCLAEVLTCDFAKETLPDGTEHAEQADKVQSTGEPNINTADVICLDRETISTLTRCNIGITQLSVEAQLDSGDLKSISCVGDVEPMIVAVDVEPIVVAGNVEPMVVFADVEPTAVAGDVEPMVVIADVEPMAVAGDVEPMVVIDDVEAMAVAGDVEPMVVVADVEPMAVAGDVEPMVVIDDVEAMAVADDVEPKIADDVEPKVVADDLEPKVVACVVEPKVVACVVEPKVVVCGVEPKVVACGVEPNIVACGVEPKVVACGVEPKVVACGVEPKVVACGVEPKIVACGVEPKVCDGDVEPNQGVDVEPKGLVKPNDGANNNEPSFDAVFTNSNMLNIPIEVQHGENPSFEEYIGDRNYSDDYVIVVSPAHIGAEEVIIGSSDEEEEYNNCSMMQTFLDIKRIMDLEKDRQSFVADPSEEDTQDGSNAMLPPCDDAGKNYCSNENFQQKHSVTDTERNNNVTQSKSTAVDCQVLMVTDSSDPVGANNQILESIYGGSKNSSLCAGGDQGNNKLDTLSTHSKCHGGGDYTMKNANWGIGGIYPITSKLSQDAVLASPASSHHGERNCWTWLENVKCESLNSSPSSNKCSAGNRVSRSEHGDSWHSTPNTTALPQGSRSEDRKRNHSPESNQETISNDVMPSKRQRQDIEIQSSANEVAAGAYVMSPWQFHGYTPPVYQSACSTPQSGEYGDPQIMTPHSQVSQASGIGTFKKQLDNSETESPGKIMLKLVKKNGNYTSIDISSSSESPCSVVEAASGVPKHNFFHQKHHKKHKHHNKHVEGPKSSISMMKTPDNVQKLELPRHSGCTPESLKSVSDNPAYCRDGEHNQDVFTPDIILSSIGNSICHKQKESWKIPPRMHTVSQSSEEPLDLSQRPTSHKPPSIPVQVFSCPFLAPLLQRSYSSVNFSTVVGVNI